MKNRHQQLLQFLTSQSPNHIIICGNYGAQNLGDEMILEGMLMKIRNVLPDCKITVFSATPTQTRSSYENYKIDSCYKMPAGFKSFWQYFTTKNYSKTKKTLKIADLFILGGGGLFNSLSKKASFIWWIQAKAALKNKCNLAMIGQSYGDLSRFWHKRVQKLLQVSKFNSARDKASTTKFEDVKMFYEPDFALDDKGQENISEGNFTLFKMDEYAGLNFSGKSFAVSLRNLDNFSDGFVRFFKQKLKGKKVTFINFQPKYDDRLHRAVASENHQIISPKTKAEAVKYIESADSVITMRLHASILAVNSSANPQILSYNEKVQNLFESK